MKITVELERGSNIREASVTAENGVTMLCSMKLEKSGDPWKGNGRIILETSFMHIEMLESATGMASFRPAPDHAGDMFSQLVLLLSRLNANLEKPRAPSTDGVMPPRREGTP